jgi:ribosome-binding ATPase YchF (GTP1/OBG family)
MEIGILGQQQSGKSTLFQIMTGVNSAEVFGEKFVRGVAKVPDKRFDKLVELFKPAKVTPAAIPFVDVNASGEGAWATIRQNLSGVDGILLIRQCIQYVRCSGGGEAIQGSCR